MRGLTQMSIRKQYVQLLTTIFSREVNRSRKSCKLTQAQMAQRLCMDERSYIKLEHGQYCCGGLTLLLFLIYCCEDVPAFLANAKALLESTFDRAA